MSKKTSCILGSGCCAGPLFCAACCTCCYKKGGNMKRATRLTYMIFTLICFIFVIFVLKLFSPIFSYSEDFI